MWEEPDHVVRVDVKTKAVPLSEVTVESVFVTAAIGLSLSRGETLL